MPTGQQRRSLAMSLILEQIQWVICKSNRTLLSSFYSDPEYYFLMQPARQKYSPDAALENSEDLMDRILGIIVL
jgi:hypothetical protein